MYVFWQFLGYLKLLEEKVLVCIVPVWSQKMYFSLIKYRDLDINFNNWDWSIVFLVNSLVLQFPD